MASLMVSSKICRFSHGRTRATINNVCKNKVHVTKIISRGLVAELELCLNSSNSYSSNNSTTITSTTNNNSSDLMDVAKLHLIMEAVADRIELHKNVAEQRNNWNHLLLSSVNMMTLSASAMAALAASGGSSVAPLKVSSTILYMAATGLLALMNCIQPSQLAEEQRNAARLFKKLHGELSTMLAIGNPTASDVEDAMEKVMALDKAFPLPLLGAMLEKFPQSVEPAVWWPQRKKKTHARRNKNNNNNNNGWDGRLEEEMREVTRVVKKKDMAEYLRLGKRVLRLNKLLAVSGPVLTGLAALGSACSSLNNNNGGLMVGVICGALACALNTLEHGGQVGMVFELYRETAGFFKLMEETIEVNLNERDPLMRENAELFEIKVALQLGRTLSELRQFADCCGCDDEFASKLF